jgi:hypothetical protein
MELTRAEIWLKRVSLAYAIIFIAAVLVFIFLPVPLFDVFNRISKSLFPSLPCAMDEGKFWLSMTVSMMATIIALSLFIYADVKKNHLMAVPLAVAKFTSSFFGLAFFILGFLYPDTKWNNLANIIIFISDFPLGIIILVLLKWVKNQSVLSNTDSSGSAAVTAGNF